MTEQHTEGLSLIDEVDRAMHSGLYAYTAYAAWGDDERATLHAFTNDDLDTGQPGVHAEWTLDFFRRGDVGALAQIHRHTGATRWTPGGVVSVYVNGEAVLDG